MKTILINDNYKMKMIIINIQIKMIIINDNYNVATVKNSK